jgi:signal peptide peptidase SppA
MTTTALAGQIFAMERSALDAALSGGIHAVVRENRTAVRVPAGVISVFGPLEYRAGPLAQLFGYGTSTLELTAKVRQLASDPNVKQILMEFDSPGGSVDGIPEAAAEIRAARKEKPVIAVAAPMAASAAFWLAAQASRLVCMASGSVGSIGVYGTHQDVSEFEKKVGIKTTLVSAGKYKTEGSPYAPLGDDAVAYLQSQVDAIYRQFVDDVAFGRGISPGAVAKGYGEGRMLLARPALQASMIDEIGSLDDVLHGVMVELGKFIAEMDVRRRRLSAYRETLTRRG